MLSFKDDCAHPFCLDESAHDLESVGSMYSAGQRAYPQHQGAAHWGRLAGAPGARPGASCRHFLLARDYAGVGDRLGARPTSGDTSELHAALRRCGFGALVRR